MVGERHISRYCYTELVRDRARTEFHKVQECGAGEGARKDVEKRLELDPHES